MYIYRFIYRQVSPVPPAHTRVSRALCISIYTYVRIHIYIYIYLYMYIYVYIYKYIHTYTYIYVKICMNMTCVYRGSTACVYYTFQKTFTYTKKFCSVSSARVSKHVSLLSYAHSCVAFPNNETKRGLKSIWDLLQNFLFSLCQFPYFPLIKFLGLWRSPLKAA